MSKRLDLNDFYVQLNKLGEVWPDIKNAKRAKRYYVAVADLETDIVEGICDVFLDSFAKMPLPSDFVEANRAFKKTYFEKTGRYYSSKDEVKVMPKHQADCSYCYDSGFEWVELDGTNAFCFCFCKEGDRQQATTNWLLPKSSEIGQVKRKVFPLAAFIPKEKNPLKINSEVFSIASRFREALKESQEFWNWRANK